MTTTVIAQIVGRNPKANRCLLRVPYRSAHRILSLPDDVLPYGLKGAESVRVRLGEIRHTGAGFTAEVEVVGKGT